MVTYKLVLIFTFITLAGCSAAPVETEHPSYNFPATIFCDRNPTVSLCQAEHVYRDVNDVFVWGDDKDNYGEADHWMEFSSVVGTGAKVVADCEDFALTSIVIGHKYYGWDLSKCKVARVLTDRSRTDLLSDHAIAICDGIAFDNRQKGPVPAEWLTSYKFYDFSYVPLTEWKLYE